MWGRNKQSQKIRKQKIIIKIRLQRQENPFGDDFHSFVCSRQTEWTRLGSALAASCSAFFAHFAPLLFLPFGLVRIAWHFATQSYQVSSLQAWERRMIPSWCKNGSSWCKRRMPWFAMSLNWWSCKSMCKLQKREYFINSGGRSASTVFPTMLKISSHTVWFLAEIGIKLSEEYKNYLHVCSKDICSVLHPFQAVLG